MKQTTLYLYYTLASALALGLVGSCSGSGSEESETDATTIDDDTDTLTTDPNATSGDPTGDPTSGPISGDLDILFVIDNSGSMSDAQRRVAAGAGELINALESGGVNYRIAVTTTDYGNPRCSPDNFPRPASQGRFDLTSCRARLDDFEFAPENTMEPAACTDVCALESITTTATGIAQDESIAPRMWIESIDGVANVDAPLADALACLLPQGINGCGYESPLEAMHRALARAEEPGEDNYGFLRAEAELLVVLVTDEADCSYNPNQQSIFLDLNNQWSWEDGASSPTSAVCWNAGVQCEGAAPGPYSACDPVDRDINGGPAGLDSAVLHPVLRYSDALELLSATKPAADVHVAAIVGVPTGYSGDPAEIPYADDADPAEQIKFGIGPGCAAGGPVKALPPVRIRELQAQVGGPGLYSICAGGDAMASALVDMASAALGG